MIGAAERLRFARICREIAAEELCGEGIGTLSEKRLHKTLKRYFCEDESCHEVRIKPDGSVSERGASGKGGYIADIFREGEIIEIQTGSFFALKAKLRFYLDNTDYKITVVHPIAAVKYLSWIDPEDGSVKSRRRSPKKGTASDALPELYWLSDMLDEPRLRFCFPLLDVDEFRLLDGWSRDKKRGSNRFEMIPNELVDEVRVDRESVRSLIPESLPAEFTRAQLSSVMKIKGRKLQNTISLLCKTGTAEKGAKKGRSYVYKITK